jgi:cob(I)alamin adenosyltransferase
LGVYLNRLSDVLFILARVINRRDGTRETLWRPSSD